MDNARFYMVWNANGNTPRRRHSSLADARDEAQRLARRHVGCAFYILEARDKYVACAMEHTPLYPHLHSFLDED